MKKIAYAIALVLLLSSCATQKIYISNSSGGKLKHEDSQTFFLSGIAQTQDINATEYCGKKGIQRVEAKQTGIDVLLSIVTFGIYTPRSVKIYCEK